MYIQFLQIFIRKPTTLNTTQSSRSYAMDTISVRLRFYGLFTFMLPFHYLLYRSFLLFFYLF